MTAPNLIPDPQNRSIWENFRRLREWGGALTFSGGGAPALTVSAGTVSTTLGSLVFQNANNVTFGLNGSTITATASGGAGGIAASAAGNSVAAGTVIWSNANNVSFGMAGSTITATATVAAPPSSSFLGGMSTEGNTAGTTGLVSQRLVLVGGANITLSQSVNAQSASLTIIGPTPPSVPAIHTTVQPVASANSVGTVTRYAAEDHRHAGLNTVSVVGNTAGNTTAGAGSVVISGGNNITLNCATAAGGMTIGVSGPTPAEGNAFTASYYENLANNAGGTAGLTGAALLNNSMMVFPLHPEGARGFPAWLTANTMMLNLSISGSTATMSQTHSTRVSFGVYTLANSTQLSLLNSVSTVFGVAVATTNGSTNAQGQRFLTFHSSQWSSLPAFNMNSVYYCALWIRSSNVSAQSFSVLGAYAHLTGVRSGTIGVNSASNTSLGYAPFLGHYGTTFSTAMPTTIGIAQINKQTASANFVPHVVLNNLTPII